MVKENQMKQTEIGLIPEDWEIVNFTDVLNFHSTGSYSRAQLKENGEFGYIHYGDIHTKFHFHIDIEKNFSGFVDKAQLKTYTKVEIGDLIMADASEDYNGIGKAIEVLNVGKNQHLISGLHTFLIRDKVKNTFALGFKGYFHTNPIIKKQYDALATGLKVFSLSKGSFKNIQIPLPPLAEQESIAAALGDCDAWIESLEAVIAKKRLIKQGAMQELLTPKDDWEEISLIEIAGRKRDLFNDGDWIESEHIKPDGIRLIQTGNIGVGKFLNRQNRKYINEKSFSDLKCKELIAGDLLICRLAEPAGRACIFPKTTNYKTVTSVDVTIFRPDVKHYNRELLMYIMCTDEWFKNVIEQVGGTTHKRISRGNLGLIKVNIPKTLSEQTRIATVLSDMDAELEALGQKLNKARQIKQGMMQELLTGRVRLV